VFGMKTSYNLKGKFCRHFEKEIIYLLRLC